MRIDAATTALGMGYGTGVPTRAIARRPGFAGVVTGADLSPYQVGAVARLAGEEGVADRVEFRANDTRRLDLPEGMFEAVVAHTHVDGPLGVVKSGGMVGIFDGDYVSLTSMPRSHCKAGLEPVASFSYVFVEIGGHFWLSAIESFPRLITSADVMTEAEAGAWADALLQDPEAGVFFGASNYRGYVAKRPWLVD